METILQQAGEPGDGIGADSTLPLRFGVRGTGLRFAQGKRASSDEVVPRLIQSRQEGWRVDDRRSAETPGWPVAHPSILHYARVGLVFTSSYQSSP